MKKFTPLALAFAFITCSAFIISSPWKMEENGSSVKWELASDSKKGEFKKIEANIEFDKKDLANSKISAVIDIKSLKVDNEGLQSHLLTADFFDAEKFPKSSFTSTELKQTETGFIARGKLTMKDSTKIADLPFTFTENGGDKAVFNGTLSIFAGDFGVMKKSKAGNDKVNIYFTLPVTK